MQMPSALVTGASSGIGLEISRVLAPMVDRLVVTGRQVEALRDLEQELGDIVEVEVIVADLSTESGVDSLIGGAGDVDLLVNNAGYGLYGRLVDQDPDGVLGIVDVNVRALTRLGHHYAAKMKASGEGRILNVASIAAFQPGPGLAVYCASKAYVLSLSRAMSAELRGSGVTVTALCPGYVETGFQSTSGMRLTGVEIWSSLPASSVAKKAVRAMMRGRREVIPGVVNWFIPVFARILPIRLQLMIVKASLMHR